MLNQLVHIMCCEVCCNWLMLFVIFFFKQKTAYEMRISDWSSDVCSSDLWAHLDWAIKRHLGGELTATEGAAAKLWHTELQWDVMDKCLKLHGGAGDRKSVV